MNRNALDPQATTSGSKCARSCSARLSCTHIVDAPPGPKTLLELDTVLLLPAAAAFFPTLSSANLALHLPEPREVCIMHCCGKIQDFKPGIIKRAWK